MDKLLSLNLALLQNHLINQEYYDGKNHQFKRVLKLEHLFREKIVYLQDLIAKMGLKIHLIESTEEKCTRLTLHALYLFLSENEKIPDSSLLLDAKLLDSQDTLKLKPHLFVLARKINEIVKEAAQPKKQMPPVSQQPVSPSKVAPPTKTDPSEMDEFGQLINSLKKAVVDSITEKPFINPMIDPQGFSWEKEKILEHLQSSKMSPMGYPLSTSQLRPNHTLKKLVSLIQEGTIDQKKLDLIQVELDPINYDLPKNPVVAPDGHCYEKTTLEECWTHGNSSSPITRESWKDYGSWENFEKDLYPDHIISTITSLIDQIQKSGKLK